MLGSCLVQKTISFINISNIGGHHEVMPTSSKYKIIPGWLSRVLICLHNRDFTVFAAHIMLYDYLTLTVKTEKLCVTTTCFIR